MDMQELLAGVPIDHFAWQYSFYAYLIYRQAAASEEEISDLEQARHAMRGHLDPIEAAAAVFGRSN